MSKARELAELGAVYDSGALSNRNLFINSGMEVAQRGTTNGPNTTNGVLVLDRWYVNASGASKTLSQESFTIGQTDVPGSPKNYLRLAVATGNDNCGVHQRIEDVTILSGKTLNLSFWAKGTNPAGGSFVSSWIQNFGSGGSSTVETEAKSGIVLTSSWQKFSFSITLPSVSGKTVGAGSYTWVEILRQPATDSGTSAWTADIALPQVELGTEATPFEHRSFGDELAKCQRYFQRLGHGINELSIAFGYLYNNGTKNAATIPVTVPMRSTPSLEGTGNCLEVKANGQEVVLNPSHYTVTYEANASQIGIFSDANTHTDIGNNNEIATVTNTSTDETIDLDAEL